jgi:hypothetical protein
MKKLLFAFATLAGLFLAGSGRADELIQPRLDTLIPLGRVKSPTDLLPLERPNDFCPPPWPRPRPKPPRPDDPWPRPWPYPPYPRPLPFPDPYPCPWPYGPCYLGDR